MGYHFWVLILISGRNMRHKIYIPCDSKLTRIYKYLDNYPLIIAYLTFLFQLGATPVYLIAYYCHTIMPH